MQISFSKYITVLGKRSSDCRERVLFGVLGLAKLGLDDLK